MKLANTMKYVRVGILAASTALFLAGPVSAQSGTDNGANTGAGTAATAPNTMNGTGANTGTGTAAGTGNAGTAATAPTTMNGGPVPNNGTGAFPYNNGNYAVHSSGGYGLWGLLGLIGLFGLLRGGRTRVTPSTPTYTRTEEYTRPRA